MIIYKIRSTNGEFSTGGTHPSFSKRGKVWTNIGHVKNHINQLDASVQKMYRDNEVEIVAYELVETILDVVSFDDLLTEISTKQSKKRAAFEARREAHRKRQRQYEYEQLKKEFEPCK